ncbi:hypothetical protein LCGC14_1198790 [marine sediment metagenome]|uniref:Uncharacterized protein n=1 Tax=marine sediment metagenome TaxID=412755 RepID=A0A0F9M4W8_9ZZZZ
MNEIIVSSKLHGDFGGEIDELVVATQVRPSSFDVVRGQAEGVMRATLIRSGCTPVARIEWRDGFVPVLDDDGNEIGERPMKFGYAYGDRLSTDRPSKHDIDRFYDEANVFGWEMPHLR